MNFIVIRITVIQKVIHFNISLNTTIWKQTFKDDRHGHHNIYINTNTIYTRHIKYLNG